MTVLFKNDICSLMKITEYTNGPAVIYVSSDRNDSQVFEICDLIKKSHNSPFSLFELKVYDWDSYLTPWEMHMGSRLFSGNAKLLLNTLENDIIPVIRDTIGSVEEIFIAGYSLAGLFSLWTVYESNIVNGAVSCSGSLWYENWDVYIKNHAPKKKVKIYISLGDKEKNSKNIFMKTVEDKTFLQVEILKNSENVSEVLFEMNEGGHFKDVNERISKGILGIALAQ